MEKDLEIIGAEEYTEASMGEIIENYYTANEDCVKKSVIQNKIDELQQSVEEYVKLKWYDQVDIQLYKINILKELLEKER